MPSQVKAEYDFDAMPGSGELNVRKGEVLTIIREGIEGGWIEGRNSKGKIGLFPETYVTRVIEQQSASPPVTAPPPLPPVPSAPLFSQQSEPSSIFPTIKASSIPTNAWSSWDDPKSCVAPPSYGQQNAGGTNHNKIGFSTSLSTSVHQASSSQKAFENEQQTTNDEWSDDDWSDEDEEVAEFTSAHRADVTQFSSVRSPAARSRSTGPESITGSIAEGKSSTGGTVRMRNINRFSNFVKTGMESYILAMAKMNMQPGERHEIIMNSNLIEWAKNGDQYSCVVDKPKKESKLKGLKSFIAYSLTCSLTGIQVSRRYKHFDWLHEQLSNKYLFIPIPPLPEKQVSGRYEEDLIEHRRSILQIWVNKICSHPVLSQSEVWKHFMSCTDEKRWKSGKRQSERDEFVGGNFFNCVIAPSAPVDTAKMERQIDAYTRHARSIDESLRNLYERISEMQKRFSGPSKVNWQKLATTFESLGQSMDLYLPNQCSSVTNAIKTSAHVTHKIGSQHEEHAKRDIEQMLDYIYVGKGYTASLTDIANVHKSAVGKIRENERLHSEGKISLQDAEAIRQRVDVTTYAMMAEIHHLSDSREKDFCQMFSFFFSQQAAFYNSIGKQMTELASLFGAK